MAHHVILASKSPRRKALLSEMGISFDVISKTVDESFPDGLSPIEAVRHIAEKKANAFQADIKTGQLVVAADTIVTLDGRIMGKPADEAHARALLEMLSGRQHQVITAVAILQPNHEMHIFHEITDVYFNVLTAAEIDYYITNYRPLDKAGAYGIQEWIGAVAVDKIVGSYTNVVGLPTAALCRALRQLVNTRSSL